MTLSCNLYIDGEFEGTINSDKEINIGKNGRVKGEITTQRLLVQGFIEGSVNAQRVEIKAQGKLHGSIESAELVIEAQGLFEGNSTIKKAAKKAPQEEKATQINKS